MKEKIENIISDEIITIVNIGGGTIADSQIIQTKGGAKYFMKFYNENSEIVKCETNGLHEIEKSNSIRVPKIIGYDKNFLILEFIEEGKRGIDFFENFAHKLAEMHRNNAEIHGFYEDNFIGSNIQKNIPQFYNWIDFFWENRLLFQFKLAEKNNFVSYEFQKLFNKLEKNVHKILEGTEEKPALIHGDLWSGNFLCDSSGEPVLIDPAIYFGHREAELAMTKMFGGFTPEFYEAYNYAYPLVHDWEYRIDLYKLYHVLNHLNLFGHGYFSQVISILKKYA